MIYLQCLIPFLNQAQLLAVALGQPLHLHGLNIDVFAVVQNLLEQNVSPNPVFTSESTDTKRAWKYLLRKATFLFSLSVVSGSTYDFPKPSDSDLDDLDLTMA